MPDEIFLIFKFLIIIAVIIGGMWATKLYVTFLPAKYVGLIILSIVLLWVILEMVFTLMGPSHIFGRTGH
jgi:hypothetical protein